MSNTDKEKVKIVKNGDKEMKVRVLTELRQDTTDKIQKVIENRIKYFDDQQKNTSPQDQVEKVVAKAVGYVAEAAYKIQKMFPEETVKKLTDTWAKMMLSF